MKDSNNEKGAELRESEERYRDLVENSSELICTHDLEGRILSANRAAAEVLGVDSGNYIGKRNLRDILAPEVRDGFDDYLAEISKDGFADGIMLVQTSTGERRLWEYHNTLRTEGVAAPIVRGMARDITERKRAEEALRQSEQLNRSVLEHIDEIIYMVSAGSGDPLRGIVEFVSGRIEQIIGYQPEEFLNDPELWFNLLHPDDVPTVVDSTRKIFQEKQSLTRVYRLRHKHTGQYRWMEDLVVPQLDDAGAVAATFGVARDITERKQSQEAVANAERKYRNMFENASEGIFQSTPDGRFIAGNPALVRMHGFDSLDELIRSRKDTTRDIYVDRNRREEFKRLLEEHGIVRGFEDQIFRRDGSKIWISVNARAVRDEDEAIRYYEGTVQDINERKRAEARSVAFVTLARKLSGARTPLDAGRIIARTAGDLFGWDSCDLNHYDADRDLVHPMLNMDTIDGRQTDVTASISGREPSARGRRVIDHGPELRLREEPVQFDEDAIPFGDRTRPSASIMTVPVRHADRVIGLLSIQSYTPHNYDNASLADLQALADHCGEALNRIRAEEELRESEERLRLALDAAHMGTFDWAVPHNRITWSRWHEALWGFKPGEFGGTYEAFSERVHHDDLPGINAEVARCIAARELFVREFRVVWPDGSVHWVMAQGEFTFGDDGQPVRMRGVVVEITTRRLAEEALRTSEERLRVGLNTANIAVFNQDLDLRYIWMHQPQLGYTSEQVMDHTDAELLPPEAARQVMEIKRRVLENGLKEHAEVPVSAGGQTFIYDLAAEPLRDANSAIIGITGATLDITERKRAEEALIEKSKLFEAFFQNTIAPLVFLDKYFNFIIVNKAYAKACQREISEFSGHNHFEFFPSDARAIFERVVETKELFQTIARPFIFPDHPEWGMTYWDWTLTPILDQKGEVQYLAFSLIDVTVRKRAEVALRESEERYRDLVENSRELICTHDLNGLVLSANPAATAALGYDLDEYVGKKTIRDLLAPEVSNRFDQYMARLRKEGTTSGIMLVQTSSGERRIWEYYNTLRTEGVAEPIVRGMARDITEQRRAERALRESEERYRELFENAKDAIYVHDLSGRYTSVNRAAERLSGFTRAEILGKHFSNFVLPRDLKHVRTNLCKKLDEENETIYEVDMVRRDGQRVPVEVSSRLIFENGVAVGVQGVARDITDRKRAQDALRTYSQRLIQAQEIEREKIARELHDEIGQVLTAVRINLQSIQRSYGTDESAPRLDESIGIVDEALGRVRELSVELRPALLDDLGLSVALRWYVDRYAQRTGITAEVLDGFEDDARLPRELETACFRIAQEALTNVARHAQAVSVSVQLERFPERMLLTIMDDGVGFDIDELRRSASAASALGLRGMEERALAVGGYIEVDSGSGRGTRIRATFPFKRR